MLDNARPSTSGLQSWTDTIFKDSTNVLTTVKRLNTNTKMADIYNKVIEEAWSLWGF